MALDFGKIFDFSVFGWAKQEGIWKYLAALFIFVAAVNYSSYYVAYSLLAPISALQNASATTAINALFHFFAFIAVLVIIAGVIGTAFSYLLISKALSAKGRKSVSFDARRWAGFIALCITNFFAALFSAFDLKMLAIGIAGIVLFAISVVLLVTQNGFGGNVAIGIAAILMLLLSLLLFAAYLVIVIRNALRLAVSEAIFVEKKIGIVESMKASWALTNKNALNIFIALVMIGIAVWIVSFAGSVPLLFYNFISGTHATGASSIAMLMNPAFLILSIPSMITSAIATIIAAFGIVAVYEELSKNSKTAPAAKNSNRFAQAKTKPPAKRNSRK